VGQKLTVRKNTEKVEIAPTWNLLNGVKKGSDEGLKKGGTKLQNTVKKTGISQQVGGQEEKGPQRSMRRR